MRKQANRESEKQVQQDVAEALVSDRQYAKFREDKDGKLGLVFGEYAEVSNFIRNIYLHMEANNIHLYCKVLALVNISRDCLKIRLFMNEYNNDRYYDFSGQFPFDVRKYAMYIDIGLGFISDRHYLFSDVLKNSSNAVLDTSVLPDNPPALWEGSRALNLPFHQAVVLFLRAVYGPYAAAGHMDELRAYIFNKDKKLYRAIQDYERGGRELPDDIAIPSEREKLRRSMQRAKDSGLESLSERDLVAVARKAARQQVPKP